MNLKKRMAAIKFDHLDAHADTSADDKSIEAGVHRKGQSGVAAITKAISVHHRVQDLEKKLAGLESAVRVVKLDPKKIRHSRWSNRHPDSFGDQAYWELKEEIENAGGNVQPIKIRRLTTVDEEGCEYELIYGHRRHRACLDLGFPVNAMVEEMDDMHLFKEMERENRNRKDLSAWEQGRMYRVALEEGLFTSQAQMARVLELSQGNLSSSIKLASLPDHVVAAFRSPLDLQFRWAPELGAALARDPDKVKRVASEISSLKEKPGARAIFERLTSSGAVVGKEVNGTIAVEGKTRGKWRIETSGKFALSLKSGVLDDEKRERLLTFLSNLLEVDGSVPTL